MIKKDLDNGKKQENVLIKKLMHHENSSILFVLLLVIVLVVLAEFFFARNMVFKDLAFLSSRNISSVLQQVSITGILAIGMTLVMLMGGIDLSVGQLMGFIGVLMASLIKAGNLPIWSIVLIGMFTAIGCELLMGLIISRTKLESFIVSLGFMSIYQGFIYLITNGREISIGDKFEFIGKTSINITSNFKIFSSVILYILLTVIIWLAIKYTKFGRRLYFVGGNESAAFLAGIGVKNFKLWVYGLNGFFVSIAAMIMISRLSTGGPNMGQGKEIDVIASVVVGGTAMSGGKGNVWGALIGVILLGCISNALNILGVNPYYQYVMKGGLIVLSVFIGYYSGLRKKSKLRPNQKSIA